mmetsp:Transcript_25901/g.60782  ORF Transcript_25901/g.60782 Transcript_25901/m.60782 type:complete len:310 (+) Transcript_25901:163-1092(+)
MRPSSATSTAAIITTTLAMVSTTSNGFCLPSPTSTTFAKTSSGSSNSALEMAKKKGFGGTKQKKKRSSNKKKKPVSAAAAAAAPPMERLKEDTEITSSDDNLFNPFDQPSTQTAAATQDLSRGKAALARMRREKAEQRNAELQKMKEVQEVDQMMRETGGGAAVIPEKVAQRMGKRMLPFVGVPLLGGMGAFVGFWYMATYRDMEFQPVLVAGTTIALLAVGLVGITYSMMSASWDPEREGTIIGTDEFSRNIDNIKGGLTRSRENAEVREQIMLEENRARQGLMPATPPKPKKPAGQSLAEKLGDEMD